jgi:hypothetical protein
MQNEAAQRAALSLIVGRLEDFARQVRQRMAAVNWSIQRDLIRLLVKRVEIDREEVTVVLRVTPTPAGPGAGPGSPNPNTEHVLHHCGWGAVPHLWRARAIRAGSDQGARTGWARGRTPSRSSGRLFSGGIASGHGIIGAGRVDHPMGDVRAARRLPAHRLAAVH